MGAARMKPRASMPDDPVDVDVGEAVGQLVHRLVEGVGVAEQRRDVPERDAALRPVGDVAHQRTQPRRLDGRLHRGGIGRHGSRLPAGRSAMMVGHRAREDPWSRHCRP